MRPGHEVEVLNLSPGGALIASAARMNPGARAELQLAGTLRRAVRGRVARCRVVCLDPLRFEGAITFDEPLDETSS
jgi:PilZ domain